MTLPIDERCHSERSPERAAPRNLRIFLGVSHNLQAKTPRRPQGRFNCQNELYEESLPISVSLQSQENAGIPPLRASRYGRNDTSSAMDQFVSFSKDLIPQNDLLQHHEIEHRNTFLVHKLFREHLRAESPTNVAAKAHPHSRHTLSQRQRSLAYVVSKWTRHFDDTYLISWALPLLDHTLESQIRATSGYLDQVLEGLQEKFRHTEEEAFSAPSIQVVPLLRSDIYFQEISFDPLSFILKASMASTIDSEDPNHAFHDHPQIRRQYGDGRSA